MMRVIVAFGRERYEWRRFRAQGEQAVAARVDLTVRQTLFSLVVTMTTAVGSALVLGVGACVGAAGRPQPPASCSWRWATWPRSTSRWSRSATPSAACRSSSSPCAARCGCSTPIRRSTSGRTRSRSAARRGHVTFERGQLQLRRRAAARSHDVCFDAPPGHAGRDRRPDRRRQEHAAEPDPALLRPPARPRAARRPRRARLHASRSLRAQVSVVLQEPLLFSGTLERQHPLRRPRGRATSEVLGRRDRRQRARLHRPAAARLRHDDRRARRAAVRRRAPAHLGRPRVPARRADPDPGRAHLVDRLAHRGSASSTRSSG